MAQYHINCLPILEYFYIILENTSQYVIFVHAHFHSFTFCLQKLNPSNLKTLHLIVALILDCNYLVLILEFLNVQIFLRNVFLIFQYFLFTFI